MDNSINIEQIMADIKRGIKEKGLTSDMLSFEDIPYRKPAQVGGSAEAQEALDYLNNNYYIQPYKKLEGNPLKVLFKKIIRKMVKFYVEPVVFEQDDFNINAVTVLNALNETSPSNGEARIEAVELEQKELIKRIEKLERENEELRRELGKQG